MLKNDHSIYYPNSLENIKERQFNKTFKQILS